MARSKAAVAAALLMALVAVASTTTFTTTVTTTTVEDEETNPRYQQCRQQLQGRQFRPCQRYFEQRGSPYEVIEMTTGTGRRGEEQQYLQQCCQQLREMDRRQCGCEAIKHAVRQAQLGGFSGRYQGEQSERIYEKAQSLPRMCGLREQQCRFTVVLV